jgi:hypothetical protein
MATTFDVVPGDTVWALTRRALEQATGQRPTNAEILRIVQQVQVPSGNVDLIFPGEQITIPVGGPASGVGPEIDAEGGGQGTPPPRRGGVGPEIDGEVGGRGGPRGPVGPEIDAEVGFPGGVPRAVAGGENLRFNPRVFGRGALDGFRSPENQVMQYRDFDMSSGSDWADLLREGAGDAIGLFARAPGTALRAVQGLRALPSGVRPALPAGPAGGYPAAGGVRLPFQFGAGARPAGAGAATRARFPSENELRAARNIIPRGR